MDSIFNSQHLLTHIVVQYMKICERAKEFHVLRQVSRLFSEIIDPNFMRKECEFSMICEVDDMRKVWKTWINNIYPPPAFFLGIEHLYKNTSNGKLWWGYHQPTFGLDENPCSYSLVYKPISIALTMFNRRMRLKENMFNYRSTPEGDPVGIVKPFPHRIEPHLLPQTQQVVGRSIRRVKETEDFFKDESKKK